MASLEIKQLKIPKEPLMVKVRYPLPAPPFRFGVIGSSGSGKTNMILYLLTTENFWLQNGESIFDEVYVFASTAKTDPTFEELKKFNLIVPVYLSTELEIDIINKIVNAEDGKKRLVYIDDFATSKKKLSDEALYSLFFRSRHNNTSVILTSQYYFQVPPAIRANLSHLAIYSLKRAKELELLRMELSTPDIRDENFDAMYHEAVKEPYNFLFHDLMKHKFYRNFTHEFTIENINDEKESQLPPTMSAQAIDEIDREIEAQIRGDANKHVE